MSWIVLGVHEYGKPYTTFRSGAGQPPMTALSTTSVGIFAYLRVTNEFFGPGQAGKVT
jgi:hypothetical protein